MQATIHIRVPHVRDGLIVANVGGVTNVVGVPNVGRVVNVGGCSYQNGAVILSEARSAEKPALSEVEGKDLRLSSSHRRTR